MDCNWLLSRLRAKVIALSGLLYMLSLAASAVETNIRFQHLGLEQGLSQETVQVIAQDSHGFMWFGTQEGLNRYDGYAFKVYSHDDRDASSISGDWVFSIAEGSDGNLWFGTDGGGLNLFNRQLETFTHFKYKPNDVNSLSNNTVRALLSGASGLLWIGTDAGLNSYDPQNNKFTRYPLITDMNPAFAKTKAKITAIVEDKQGYLWIGSDGGGLFRLEPMTGIINAYVHHEQEPQSLLSNKIRSLLIDNQDRLWIGSYDNGLSRLDKNRQGFTNFQDNLPDHGSHGSKLVRAIYQDKKGTIWIATDNGLDRWIGDGQGFIHFRHDIQNLASLSGNKITSIFQDKGGVFWVGSYSGLNKWNTATASFAHHHVIPNEKYSLSSNGINAFHQSNNGKIWVGTYDGLNQLDQQSLEVINFNSDQKQHSLSDPRVISLYEDANDIVWIGTRGSGLDRLDKKTGGVTNFKHQPDNANSIGANGVTVIKPAANSRLWLGTWGGGLNLFDPKLNQFTRYSHQTNDQTSLSSDRVISVFEDSTGLLWIGTWGGGLNLFNPVSARVIAVMRRHSNDINSLNSNIIWASHEDKAGNLWFGTHGGGLNHLSAKDRYSGHYKFTHYNRRDGLASNVIYGILEDEIGYLWLSTNRGLAKFDPITKAIINYDSSHGLQGNEFNSGAYFKAGNGKMYFGGTNGITAFNPADIKPNGHVPPVVLTKFLKMNQEDPKIQPLRHGDSVEIDYKDYLVAFEFAGLDFASPTNNNYRYKLVGFDQEWIDAGTLRRATYTNLPAGQYTLKVSASNNDGIWNESGIELAVTVLAAPWKSWWAYTAYTFLLVGLLALVIKAYKNKLNMAARYRTELEQEVQARTQELQVANEQLLNASVTDQLTGLHNRRYLSNIIEQEVAEIDRKYHLATDQIKDSNNNCPRLFLLMFDLDDFKPINDTYGHSAGDQVIVAIGQLLKEQCRKSDTLIRWGGDEFLVLGKIDDAEEVSLLAERLRYSVQHWPFDIGLKQKLHLSCSIGFAFYPFAPAYPNLVSWEQVQIIADKALYQSKEQGRNAWHSVQATKKRPPISFMNLLMQDIDKAVDMDYVNVIGSPDNYITDGGEAVTTAQEKEF